MRLHPGREPPRTYLSKIAWSSHAWQYGHGSSGGPRWHRSDRLDLAFRPAGHAGLRNQGMVAARRSRQHVIADPAGQGVGQIGFSVLEQMTNNDYVTITDGQAGSSPSR